MFLNGVGIIRPQVFVATAFAVACVLLKVYITMHIGIAGIVIGAVVAYLATTLSPYGVLVLLWLARGA